MPDRIRFVGMPPQGRGTEGVFASSRVIYAPARGAGGSERAN